MKDMIIVELIEMVHVPIPKWSHGSQAGSHGKKPNQSLAAIGAALL